MSEATAQLLARVVAYADAHLADPTLDVPRLARAAGVSRRNLHDRLKRAGMPSASIWLREHRLDRAEQLLRRGAFSTVGEVAAAVGMSRSYFTRMYKARTGSTPGEALAKDAGR